MKLTVIRGSSTTEPHVVELTREAPQTVDVKSRQQGDGIGYVRIASFGRRTAEQLRSQIASLTKGGATRLIIDVRNSARRRPRRGHRRGAAVRRLGHHRRSRVALERAGEDCRRER